MNSKTNKLHRSWLVLIGCILLFAINYGLVFTNQGLFIPVLIKELGVSPSQGTLVLTICSIAVIASTSLSGIVAEKLNIRIILTLSGFLMALSYLVAANTRNIYILYITTIPQGLSFGLIAVTTATLVQRWFWSKRSLALGLTYIGTGIGGIIFCPLITDWLYSVGYQKTYFYIFIAISLAYIIIFFLLANSPDKCNTQPYGYIEGIAEESDSQYASNWEGFSFKEALRMPEFYMLFLVSTFMVTILAVLAAQTPYMLDVNGVSPVHVGYVLTIYSFVVMIAGPLMGFINEKFGDKAGNIYIFTIIILFCFSIIFAKPQMTLIVLSVGVTMGLADAANVVPIPIWVGSLFGTKNFEKILTIMVTGGTIGNVIMLYFSGLDVEYNGNFNLTLTLLTVFAIISFILIFIIYSMIKKRKSMQGQQNTLK